MNNKIFILSFCLILIFGLVIRILPTQNNNFYFTMDQGDEAVKAREIWFRHKIPLIGQATSMQGVYHGPFWVWYISIGYFLFRGHPFGALFMLMLLKLAVTGILVWKLKDYIFHRLSLLTGFSLLLFWPFYDASRYAFSPFPLVSIAILTILFLTEAKKRSWEYVAAAIPVGMIIHTELASFPPFFVLCLLVGLRGVIKKYWTWKNLLFFIALLSLFFIPHLITETSSDFPQLTALKRNLTSPESVFSISKEMIVTRAFVQLFAESVTPVKPLLLSGMIIAVLLFVFIKAQKYIPQHSKNFTEKYNFSERFITITILLFLLSWVWFASSSGWNPWHTVYIPPTLFIAVLLAVWNLPKKIAVPLFLIIISAQILAFSKQYQTFFKPSSDPSLLTNELAGVEWVYQKAQGEGFYVYSYLPSVNDYPYQYLFWWYGRKKYGYIPCEYSTYPNTPSLFVPGLKYYQQPQRTCGNKRFLIIEPDKNTALQEIWLTSVRAKTSLIDKTQAGATQIEERLMTEK